MTIEFYKAKDGWRWHITARNGDKLADSGEAYVRRIDAVTAARRVTGRTIEAPARGGFAVRWSR